MTTDKYKTGQGPAIYWCIAFALIFPPALALSGAWYSFAPYILLLVPARAWGMARVRGSVFVWIAVASFFLTAVSLYSARSDAPLMVVLQAITVLLALVTTAFLLVYVRRDYVAGRF